MKYYIDFYSHILNAKNTQNFITYDKEIADNICRTRLI